MGIVRPAACNCASAPSTLSSRRTRESVLSTFCSCAIVASSLSILRENEPNAPEAWPDVALGRDLIFSEPSTLAVGWPAEVSNLALSRRPIPNGQFTPGMSSTLRVRAAMPRNEILLAFESAPNHREISSNATSHVGFDKRSDSPTMDLAINLPKPRWSVRTRVGDQIPENTPNHIGARGNSPENFRRRSGKTEAPGSTKLAPNPSRACIAEDLPPFPSCRAS